jgi:hypothetical protein
MTLIGTKTVLAAKIEATPGTFETLSASDAAFNIMDPVITPNVAVSTRPHQGAFGNLPGVAETRTGTCTFMLEYAGDGSGGVPTWAALFLAGCGVVNSTGTLTPRDEITGSNVKTLSFGLYEDGRRHKLTGAAGNCVMTFPTGNTIQMAFTFTGIYLESDDEALPSPTYPTIMPMRAASGGFTINSIAQACSSVVLDFGNQVTVRPSIATASGYSHAIITDRFPTFTIDPEAKLIATDGIFADWIAGTTRALSLSSQTATDKVTITAPAVQKLTIAQGDREGVVIDNQTLECRKTGTSPLFTITIAAP